MALRICCLELLQTIVLGKVNEKKNNNKQNTHIQTIKRIEAHLKKKTIITNVVYRYHNENEPIIFRIHTTNLFVRKTRNI